MKVKNMAICMGMLIFVQKGIYYPSQLQARYVLRKDSVHIEAGSVDEFDPYSFLLRNNHALKEEDKKKFIIQGEVDVQTLGTYEVTYNDTHTLEVTIEDTTSPTMKLQAIKVPLHAKFEWDEEQYNTIIQDIHDNYTDVETLKDTFACDDVDTSSAGNKEVNCRVSDASGNETVDKVAVAITAPMHSPSNANTVMGTSSSTLPIPSAAYSPQQMAQLQEVANLVNVIRSEHGLQPLVLDMGNYHNVTYLRAVEVEISYAHIRPNGKSSYTIFSEYGIGFQSAGENLAKGQQTAQEVVNDWMNSPTHAENILRSEFRILSVGVLGEGANKVWIQTFFS